MSKDKKAQYNPMSYSTNKKHGYPEELLRRLGAAYQNPPERRGNYDFVFIVTHDERSVYGEAEITIEGVFRALEMAHQFALDFFAKNYTDYFSIFYEEGSYDEVMGNGVEWCVSSDGTLSLETHDQGNDGEGSNVSVTGHILQ